MFLCYEGRPEFELASTLGSGRISTRVSAGTEEPYGPVKIGPHCGGGYREAA
jgi:hypothetical protein